jgi:hypothetical protein
LRWRGGHVTTAPPFSIHGAGRAHEGRPYRRRHASAGQDAPACLSDYAYLALTSGVAGILLAVIFFRLMRSVTATLVRHAAILSVLITGNMLFERMALVQLPASTVSSLAAMNIVIVRSS